MARRRAGSTTWSTRLVLKELEEPHASRGTTTDRISLPAACLEALGGAISPDRDPLTVRIALRRTPGAPTVCAGISDFGAPEGTVAIPPWMAAQLKATPGAFLHIQRVDLPRADSCVFRAVDPSFFALRDQRAVLEQALSTQYTTLTKGTTIAIAHHGAEYYLEVVELEPEDACLIIDTGSTVVVAGKSTVAGRVARVRPPLLWAAQKNRCRNGQPHKAGSSACASYFECMS
eukprot:m.247238 g.247238  ORF g.247238 m.247238 type:complete len:232 (-) comp10968_c3_seq48:1183-1878(-)